MNDDAMARTQGLSPAKRALLMRALLEQAGTTNATIPRRPSPGPAVLSFAQQRMWLLHELDPETAAMNLYYAVRLRGRLDVAALAGALRTVVSRHEVLRSTFGTVDGEPVQILGDLPDPVLRVLPVTVPPAQRDAEVRRLAEADAGTPFDLERGPMLRATLLRIDDDEHVLLIVMPHAVADGWSLGVLVGEVREVYAGGNLPELAVQYADYAHWQRRVLPDDHLADGVAYWRDRLAGAPANVELPTDRPRPPRQSQRGALWPVELPAPLIAGLRDLARAEGATLFMALLAGFLWLLHRYSRQTDISVGTPVANRAVTETERLIGYFGNTLVLRTELSGEPTFRELLARVREVALGAYEHQQTPFEHLVEELRPVRDPSRTPFFQIMFILQNAPLPALELPGLGAEVIPVHNGTAKYDLTLDLTATADGVRGVIEYSTDLFDQGRIERLAGHLSVLLGAAIAEPDRPLPRQPLLTAPERRQILREWNDTATPRPSGCVHEIIEAQAAATPERVAARCGQEEITYGELNRRANRLARTLRAAGVGPEVLVGLLGDRGIRYLVAFLAILKAGGACLPLDPQQPAGRLARMVGHSRCALVLAADEWQALAGQVLDDVVASGAPRVPVRPLTEPDRPGDDDDLPPLCTGRNLAYVLYTSGSTGTPKGVMVEHAGLTNHLYAKIRDLGITGSDVVAQNGPQTFDVSVWQFLAALTCGGRTEILPDAVAHDPVRLLAEVERGGVTILQVVPSVLRGMVDEAEHGERPACSALRWMVPTGDALMAELCQRWFALYPGIPMLNTYGSTECSDDQCHLVLSTAPDGAMPIVSIGTPIGNMRAYVLDERLAPVPVGVPGELYIGGLGVGRGYLGEPGRTADAFRPDPYASEPGARIYRTRDLAQSHPDGRLEFLGRTDHLVKVHGFRVEPGEVEATLTQHPDVRDTVVVGHADGAGHTRLVGYVVGDTTPAELRAFLRERLPEYLVPAVFVMLDALPLNSNGKVDRAALPAPDPAVAAVAFVAPRTPMEEAVAEVWREVLGRDRVGVEESFFDLGGHSLLAMQVLTRLSRRLSVELPLRLLFEFDTVATLARELDERTAGWDGLAGLVETIEDMSDEEVARLLREHEPPPS